MTAGDGPLRRGRRTVAGTTLDSATTVGVTTTVGVRGTVGVTTMGGVTGTIGATGTIGVLRTTGGDTVAGTDAPLERAFTRGARVPGSPLASRRGGERSPRASAL
jgi:hypothetical protein